MATEEQEQRPPHMRVSRFSGTCRKCGRDMSTLVRGRESEALNGAHVECSECGTTNWCDSREQVMTDGGSKYTRETGDGYAGVHRVSTGSTEINMVTVGIERGTQLYLTATGTGPHTSVQITTDRPDTEPISTPTVNNAGYISVAGPVLNHLGTENGDDIRLYRCEEGAFELVAADDDPHVVTDGGQVPDDRSRHELVTDARASLNAATDRLDERHPLAIVLDTADTFLRAWQSGSEVTRETALKKVAGWLANTEPLLEDDPDVADHVDTASRLVNRAVGGTGGGQ